MNGHFHLGNAKRWNAPVWFVSWRLGWNPFFRDFVLDRSRFRLTRRHFHLSVERIL